MFSTRSIYHRPGSAIVPAQGDLRFPSFRQAERAIKSRVLIAKADQFKPRLNYRMLKRLVDLFGCVVMPVDISPDGSVRYCWFGFFQPGHPVLWGIMPGRLSWADIISETAFPAEFRESEANWLSARRQELNRPVRI